MAFKKSTLRSLAVLAIALVGIFYPETTDSIARSLASTDENVARSLAGTCEDCTLPAYLEGFSLITELDAAISTKTVYKGIAVGGVLTDSSPNTNTVVSSNSNSASFVNKSSGKLNINFNGPVKYDATLKDGGIDFEALQCIAKRAKDARMGEYRVIVKTTGGTFNTFDFVNGGQGEDNGKTIVVFQTEETVILDKTSDGRQFGPTVLAPFSRVEVTSRTGFVDGVIIAKSFYSPESASSVQLHGDMYQGKMACSDPVPTPAPVEPPTPAPVEETKAPIEPPTPAPVDETKPPSLDAGVNGDPLIMGLSGQLFKFDGLNGAWYSAVSTPLFQWNLKVNRYETCPAFSDNFVSGAGFTFFNKDGSVAKKIEANVVNTYNVDVGCGDEEQKNCLGAGSLELVIDGVKHVVGGDYKSNDGMARITAFNTFHQCSRKWYDFDVRPSDDFSKARGLRHVGRSIATSEPSIFDVIASLKSTMIDMEACQDWINHRQRNGDLFLQSGHYSTVIIKTADITLHLEYKQEKERCSAHSIDVWIASVSPKYLNTDWEGIIGETKDPNYVSIPGKEPVMLDRSEALKFPLDKDYEVNSPFSTKCKGCYHHHKH